MAHVESVNSGMSNELALRIDRGEPPTVALLDSLRKTNVIWKHRDVCAWYGAKPLPVCGETKGVTPFTQPAFLKNSFSEIIRDRGGLFLRAATVLPARNEKLMVVSSEALDEQLVQEIARNLGEITLYAHGIQLQDSASPTASGSSSDASQKT